MLGQVNLTFVVFGAGLRRVEAFTRGVACRGLLGLALRVLVLDDALAQLGIEHESLRAGVEFSVGAGLVGKEGLTHIININNSEIVSYSLILLKWELEGKLFPAK